MGISTGILNLTIYQNFKILLLVLFLLKINHTINETDTIKPASQKLDEKKEHDQRKLEPEQMIYSLNARADERKIMDAFNLLKITGSLFHP